MIDHRTQFWAVSVTRNGETLVTIESGCLSGKPEFAEEEARVIRIGGEDHGADVASPKVR